MAITLEANYAKRLGLPNYSSHQYSITLKAEITDLSQIEAESVRLYRLLQDAVDQEIQEVGFIPNVEYGNNHQQRQEPQQTTHQRNGNTQKPAGNEWKCSEKQKNLILKIIDEHKINTNDIDDLAKDRFNKPVKFLNKLEASGLIDELLEKYGDIPPQKRYSRPFARGGAS